VDITARSWLVLFYAMENIDLLTAEETAALLRIDVKALYWLNYSQKGPKRRRLGRELRYLRSDVVAWFDSLPAE
jgi:predicted DNA-binding transcriptional regulator AlpA